ncbi:MAG: hypothetical protein ACREQH_08420, partial [Candidatus Binatus sp.]
TYCHQKRDNGYRSGDNLFSEGIHRRSSYSATMLSAEYPVWLKGNGHGRLLLLCLAARVRREFRSPGFCTRVLLLVIMRERFGIVAAER